MHDSVRRLLVVVVALGLFAGLSVAPVSAATGDSDDPLGIVDDGLNIDDGVSVGGDDGVEVGVDDGVNASVGGDDGVEVGVGGDDPVEVGVGGREVTDGAPDDVVSGVDALDGNGLDDETGATDLADDGTALGGSGVAGDGLNLSETTGLDTCELTRISGDKLPTESLPGLDTLPSDLQIPGVPTSLLSTDAVVALATGFVPSGCEVVDLEDPQVDPTDPPTDPDYGVDVMRFQQTSKGLVVWITFEGTLDESGDGPSVGGGPKAYVGPNYLEAQPDTVFNVGESTYGSEDLIIERENDDVKLGGVAILVGRNAGANVECTGLTEFEGDLSQETLADLGPCEYELVGIPTFFGPEQLFGVLETLGSGGAPVDPGDLPVPVDQLLNL